MSEEPSPSPVTDDLPPDVAAHFGVRPLRYLGGRGNRHWQVESGGERYALRQFGADTTGSLDIAYEMRLLRRLHELGWPVPLPVAGPHVIGGQTWCLFTWLPGQPRLAGGVEGRLRGRLLAELHKATASLTGMGQRGGGQLSDETVADPGLAIALQAYERLFPAEGHILRWHHDVTKERFAAAGQASLPQVVLHGDFAPWNLIFEGDRLTGVLDFEAAHLNYRIADFALAWRGEHDEVIAGYQEMSVLSYQEVALLAPALWSWTFLGVKDAIEAMLAGKAEPQRFEWQIKHLLRRSAIFAAELPAYPGR